ncbi:Homocysteine/cysteine synthase [Microsporum ferrugineum]
MTNVGDSKTMMTHPWSSTHVIMSEKDWVGAGITEDLLRLSVGTEDVEDLIHDFDQALASTDLPLENVINERSQVAIPVSNEGMSVQGTALIDNRSTLEEKLRLKV